MTQLLTLDEAVQMTGLPAPVIQQLARQDSVRSLRFPGGGMRVRQAEMEALSPADIEQAKDALAGKKQIAWLETYVERLKEEVARLNVELGKAIEATTVDGGQIPLRSFYVYVIRDQDGEIAYIGQSRNVFSRVGSHVMNEARALDCHTVQLIPCQSEQAMCDIEKALISHHKPRHNVTHTGRSTPRERIR